MRTCASFAIALAACVVSPAHADSPVFARDIAPILYRHCAQCHHPGGIGPMSLLDYGEIRKFAPMIREVVQTRRMPPWHADPNHGTFKNARVLSEAEIATISAWVDGRTPLGDSKDLPPKPEFHPQWIMGAPDAVFEMPEEAVIPADGRIPYRYYTTPTNFEEDKWISAVEVKAGNPKVVHHVIVFNGSARPAALGRDISLGLANAAIKGFGAGVDPLILPPGYAMKIPKGAMLLWQMHYTPTGKEERDRSKIAFRFADAPPKYEYKTAQASNGSFLIPAGAPNHRVDAEYLFDEDISLLTLNPHMHLRGKSFEYAVEYPGGEREIVLRVPRYDFAWQTSYDLATPLFLPAGSRLRCTAHFDNSADNPANPDPSKSIRWGDQVDDEMMAGFFHYVSGRTHDAAERVHLSAAE